MSIVTDGGNGIGRVIVIGLTGAGASVPSCGRTQKEIKSVAEEIDIRVGSNLPEYDDYLVRSLSRAME